MDGEMSREGRKRSRDRHMADAKQFPQNKRKRTLGVDISLEEQRLKKLVFSDVSDIIANLNADDEIDLGLGVGGPSEDVGGTSQSACSNVNASSRRNRTASEDDSGVEDGGSSPSEESLPVRREPVWMDEDDDGIMVKDAIRSQNRNLPDLANSAEGYSTYLKRKFESVVGTPKWAELNFRSRAKNDSESDSDGEDMIQHSGPFLSGRATDTLPKNRLETKRLLDLNANIASEGFIITSTEFHPTSTVALIANLSGSVSIVQVDGKTNTKLQTVQFSRFPVRSAHFTKDGTQFIVGSQHHGHFFVYDMMEGRTIKVPIHQTSEMTHMKKFSVSPDGRLLAVPGRFGNIHLVTALSKEWIGSLKMNGEVKNITFNNDGSRLYSHGDGGEVYIWDMNSRSCIHRFVDDGTIEGTCLAISPNNQYLACGSTSGVVNIYESASLQESSAPRPLKMVLNLVTPISALSFNSTSEILAMSSLDKDNAFRLMHFPSMTVFENFPRLSENVFRPQCLAFSPQSAYLTIGNNRGRALLYRLKHFKNY